MSIILYHKPRPVDFAGNRLFLQIKGSRGETVIENYHLTATISVEKLSEPGTYSELPEFRLDIDTSDIAELYDFGNIIKRRFFNFFDLPDFEMLLMAKTKVLMIGYNIVIREMSGTSEIQMIVVDNLKALNGKVNTAHHLQFDLLQWINAEKKFLTNSPGHIYTFAGAKHYLYYLNPSPAATTIMLSIEAITRQGDEEYLSTPFVLQAREAALIPVADIINNEWDDDVINARVWIQNPAQELLAGVKTYHFMQRDIYDRAFLFQNRFGVFDTITVKNQDNSLSSERDEKVRTLAPGYKRLDGDVSSELLQCDDTFEAETGPIPIAMAQHYKEIAESNAVFLQEKDRFLRVVLDPGTLKVFSETDDLQNVKFKYRPAFSGDFINSQINMPSPAHEDYSNEYLKTDYQ
jgi:hypothetical protein